MRWANFYVLTVYARFLKKHKRSKKHKLRPVAIFVGSESRRFLTATLESFRAAQAAAPRRKIDA